MKTTMNKEKHHSNLEQLEYMNQDDLIIELVSIFFCWGGLFLKKGSSNFFLPSSFLLSSFL